MSYSPTLGRWMQTDPIGYVDGLNLQEFVSSNPTNLLDPFGLQATTNRVLEPTGTGTWDGGEDVEFEWSIRPMNAAEMERMGFGKDNDAVFTSIRVTKGKTCDCENLRWISWGEVEGENIRGIDRYPAGAQGPMTSRTPSIPRCSRALTKVKHTRAALGVFMSRPIRYTWTLLRRMGAPTGNTS